MDTNPSRSKVYEGPFNQPINNIQDIHVVLRRYPTHSERWIKSLEDPAPADARYYKFLGATTPSANGRNPPTTSKEEHSS